MTGACGPGLFITFEGVEGAGKSTQIGRAVEWLQQRGHTVYVTREPGGGPLAERIRDLILHTEDDPPVARAELLLMLAARAQHVDTVIRPRLARGETVVCDRFYDSTIAYQGFARGLDLDFVRGSVEFAVDNLHPDLTIVLDLEPAEGLARQQSRNRMEAEKLAFHEAVRRGFLDQAAREPERIRVVSAAGAVEDVTARVAAVLEEALWPARSGARCNT